MTSSPPYASANNGVTNFNWEKWLDDNPEETDDKIIEDANKSVDEEVRIRFINNNLGLDNEFVNLSRDSIAENEATTVVSQSPHQEPATEQVLEANDQDDVLMQTQDREQTATSPAELPAYIKELLEENGPSISQSEVITVGCRDSNKKARRKSFPKPSEVHQPQAELPTFIEGLLENTACSSGKRKAECNGKSESKKRGSKTLVDSTATNQQFPHKEEIKRQKRRERERLRSKVNRDKKRQLDADNDAKRLSLDKEVDRLRDLVAEKEEMMKHLALQKDSEIQRLQHEKDLEIVYLQKKVKRLEHEVEEKNAKIVFLQNKLECQT